MKPEWERCVEAFEEINERLEEVIAILSKCSGQTFTYTEHMKALELLRHTQGKAGGASWALRMLHKEERVNARPQGE